MTDVVPLRSAHLLSTECLEDTNDETFIAGETSCVLKLSGGSEANIKIRVYKGLSSKNKKGKRKLKK
jgi:hypothetical protein